MNWHIEFATILLSKIRVENLFFVAGKCWGYLIEGYTIKRRVEIAIIQFKNGEILLIFGHCSEFYVINLLQTCTRVQIINAYI